jgi:hypothetical protein
MAARASVKPQEQAPKPIPIEERIRQRAYEVYLERDGRAGTALADWLQAETEIIHTVEQNYVDAATSGSHE